MENDETICAIATPAGGALGIVRVSGARAIEVVNKIFVPSQGAPLAERRGGSLVYGNLLMEGGELLDEVVVSLFRAPHSYTGEDSVEISCHGSLYILQQLMQRLTGEGCRQAAPGEYTQRAFLNGKMDLSRAEAVADLIASTSAASHRLAMSQLRGGFGRELRQLRQRLLNLVSLVELELDFGEEEVEFADRAQLRRLSGEIYALIDRLASSFKVGNAIKNGVPVAIVGEPNAGKSTLLNLLLNEERAIVSDQCGTTRDTIEECVNIGGTTFRLIDTAGLRDTADTVESMGIERSLKAMQQSSIVVWVVDATLSNDDAHRLQSQIAARPCGDALLLLLNKCDLVSSTRIGELTAHFATPGRTVLPLSARTGHNADRLRQQLVELAAIPQITQNDVIVTNVRHHQALTLALQAIARVRDGLDTNLPGDLLSQDLRECSHHLSDILGEVTNAEVLQNIFKNFCIGK